MVIMNIDDTRFCMKRVAGGYSVVCFEHYVNPQTDYIGYAHVGTFGFTEKELGYFLEAALYVQAKAHDSVSNFVHIFFVHSILSGIDFDILGGEKNGIR